MQGGSQKSRSAAFGINLLISGSAPAALLVLTATIIAVPAHARTAAARADVIMHDAIARSAEIGGDAAEQSYFVETKWRF